MYIYGPHFTLRCECKYMVLTLHCDVNVCIWSSLYLEMCMYVYGLHFTLRCVCIWSSLYLEMCMYVYDPHFTLRCVCMYMVFTLP